MGNHVAKFGKDPIYRTKVIVRKPVWTPACPPAHHTQSHNMTPSRDGRITKNKNPAQIHFHLNRPHTITKVNDNINMNRTIEGSVNALRVSELTTS